MPVVGVVGVLVVAVLLFIVGVVLSGVQFLQLAKMHFLVLLFFDKKVEHFLQLMILLSVLGQLAFKVADFTDGFIELYR